MNAKMSAMILWAALGFSAGAAKPVITVDTPPAEILVSCRAALPTKPIALDGSMTLRSRKGIVKREFDYTLTMNRSAVPAIVSVELREKGKTNVIEKVTLKRPGPVPEGRVQGTDVTWLDLTLDFLWWTDAEYDTEREGETVHGQHCLVIVARPPQPMKDIDAVRIWVDPSNGAMLQAEQLKANEAGALKPVRRLWGTRVKKFGERWMANVLEVEMTGSGHRTKIVVDDLKDL